MPGRITPARRSRSSFEEDDGDLESLPGSDAGMPQTNGSNKRARVTNGDSRGPTGQSWRLDTPQTISHAGLHGKDSAIEHGLPAYDADDANRREHQPGAIVCIKLTNFVTYTNATFYPGSSLNMVIGPNGTGKSTLVCAICLGLGFSPKNLGRAKDAVEFIKHGAQEAIIEIELKGKPGRTNPIFERKISHQRGGNHYRIGQRLRSDKESVRFNPSNEKSVRALAATFNIQIDNLCQFLPQDRVAEFANLKPVEKLAATIRAAAPQEMTDQHDELKRLRREQGTSEKTLSEDKNHLANLEKKHESQRQDVQRIKERREVLEERNFLVKMRPSAEYRAGVEKHRQSKAEFLAAKAELQQLRAEIEPSTRATKEKQNYAKKIEEVVKFRQINLKNFEGQCQSFLKEGENLARKVQGFESQRNVEKRARSDRWKKIAMIKSTIQDIQQNMKNEPPEVDGAEYNERKRVKQRDINAIKEQLAQLKETRYEYNEEFRQKKICIEEATARIQSLKTTAGQRETILEAHNADVARAWRLVKNLQGSGQQSPFRGRIFGPPLLECSVVDESWANAVESVFQQQELLALTCTYDEDMRTLSDLLSRERLNNVSIRTILAPLSSFKPPVSAEEMQRLGIAGWAVDKISGSDTLLAMLCSEKNAHRTALLEEESSAQYEALMESQVDIWTTRQKSTRITRRREYNVSSTRTSIVKQAQFWVSQPVDNNAIYECQEKIDGWRSDLEALKVKGLEAREKEGKLDKEAAALEGEIKAIEKEKAVLQRARSEFTALPMKLNMQQKQLQAVEQEDLEQSKNIDELAEKQAECAYKRAKCAVQHADMVTRLRSVHAQLLEASVALLEAQSDIQHLKDRNVEIERLLADRNQAFQDMKKAFDELVKDVKRKKLVFEQLMEDDDFANRLRELPDDQRSRTIEQLESDIESLDARLDLLQGGNESLISQFESRERDIATTKAQIEAHGATMQSINDTIASVRTDWEPKLDALISKISTAFGAFFARIECAGEVSVFKAGPTPAENATAAEKERDDDFENWAVMLKVKFREHEELSVLDSHRQSGGERAVSTMFYLMALQRLSLAPFRVVDEINQGMDPRNERIVHGLMVDIACGEDAYSDARRNGYVNGDGDSDEEAGDNEPQAGLYGGSQYFLVTPKLLTNLKYKRGMKVHSIMSGEHMPKDDTTLNLKKLVEDKRKLMAGGKGKGRAMDNGEETNGVEAGSREVSVAA